VMSVRTATLEEVDDPLLGRAFGSYVLVRAIAQGGQCSVYEARSATERVALKILHVSRPRTAESDERLRREAVAIQRIEHPNVVRLLDYGETSDGSPWLAMEYLDGESLATLLGRVKHLPEVELVALFAPICAALEAAHQRGVVHRDLKPQNIMLVEQGGVRVPKLLDFGIARLLDEGALTTSLVVRGTPMYMASEQWEGLRHADERSDIYSLGAIAYQAASGRLPFAADTPLGWMKQVQSEPALDLAIAMDRRAVSPAFASTVMKALAKDPDERPQTPAEFLRGLRPPTRSASARAAAPRRRRPAALGLALAALLAVAGAYHFTTRGAGATPSVRAESRVVLVMDTPAARGVYDADAAARGGTNADALNDVLGDLPVTIQKETIPSDWDREAHVLELSPELIVIHRSAFFHGLNGEFGFGYPPFADEKASRNWALLYRMADDKLISFLGLIASVREGTKFLVYSRGTDPRWRDPKYRAQWESNVEQRFPAIRGRVSTIAIEGGMNASFKASAVAQQFRESVRSILGLAKP